MNKPKSNFDPPVFAPKGGVEARGDTALARAVRGGACVNCGKGSAPFCTDRCRAEFRDKVGQRAYEVKHGCPPPVRVGAPRKRQVHARQSKMAGLRGAEVSTFGARRSPKTKPYSRSVHGNYLVK